MLHSTMSNDASPHGEFRGGSVSMQELDARSYGSRSEEGSEFAETSPRMKRCVSFAGDRCSVTDFRASARFGRNEGLWGTGVQELK